MNEKKLEKGFLLLFAISVFNTDDTPQFETKSVKKPNQLKIRFLKRLDILIIVL